MAIKLIVRPGIDSAFLAWRAPPITNCRGFAMTRRVKRAPGSAPSPATTGHQDGFATELVSSWVGFAKGPHVDPGTRNLQRFEESGDLVTGRTLDELAQKIGVPAAALRDTVARHNRFAETGVDLDFGKGETELNRFNGDPGHKPKPCIGGLATPPFHALAVWPADIAVSTGLATDADARVLDQDARPIPGLYACGNDMASIMRGHYPGPGINLGPALVFGYRAAMMLAGKPAA